MLSAVDHGNFAALLLLDLSAAFDTVDNDVLLQRLQESFGIGEMALDWFHSYLSDQTQYVRRGCVRSSAVHLVCGVPQGSVLGTILFILYVANLAALTEKYYLMPHQYADDTQIYGACSPSDVGLFSSKVSEFVDDISSWMWSNRLQLNLDKT
jgi:hypothetical protein